MLKCIRKQFLFKFFDFEDVKKFFIFNAWCDRLWSDCLQYAMNTSSHSRGVFVCYVCYAVDRANKDQLI